MIKLLGIVIAISAISLPVNAADYKDQASKTVDDYLSHVKQKKMLENQMELLRLKTEIARAYNECISAGAAPEDCDVAGTVSRSSEQMQNNSSDTVNAGLDSSAEDSMNEPASIRLLRELSAEIKGVKTRVDDNASNENPEDIPKFIKVIGNKAYFSTSSGIIGAGKDTELPGGYIVKNFNLTTSFLEKNGIEYIVAMDWKKEDSSKKTSSRPKYARPIR